MRFRFTSLENDIPIIKTYCVDVIYEIFDILLVETWIHLGTHYATNKT